MILKPSDIRKMAREWLEKGFSVEIEPDGKIRITPPTEKSGNPFDAVDYRK